MHSISCTVLRAWEISGRKWALKIWHQQGNSMLETVAGISTPIRLHELLATVYQAPLCARPNHVPELCSVPCWLVPGQPPHYPRAMDGVTVLGAWMKSPQSLCSRSQVAQQPQHWGGKRCSQWGGEAIVRSRLCSRVRERAERVLQVTLPSAHWARIIQLHQNVNL